MAYWKGRTEHAGAKRGRGAYWGYKADAKQASKKGRRAADAAMLRPYMELAVLHTALGVPAPRYEPLTGRHGGWTY